MKRILILGAGKSTPYLITYLSDRYSGSGYTIVLADKNIEAARLLAGNAKNVVPEEFNTDNASQRSKLIQQAELVISFLPPRFHLLIAKDCLTHGKNLVTPSYTSPELLELSPAFAEKKRVCINETGLDPGIDHASACLMINKLKSEGAAIHTFESYTGGLTSPESANNPWQYKLTWNAGGVVLAGQGVNRYLHKGHEKILPPHRLFGEARRLKSFDHENYSVYPNRDSIPYRERYGLQHAHTVIRGTIRPTPFCKAWDHLVQLGYTLDAPVINSQSSMTFRDLTCTLLPKGSLSPEEKLTQFLNCVPTDPSFLKLKWLGLLDDTPLPLASGSPAQQLKELLVRKWAMDENDKDMILMIHLVGYERDGQNRVRQHLLIRKGKDHNHTAMAETVGIPAGICAALILEKKLNVYGMISPTEPEVYNPMMKELHEKNIRFQESDQPADQVTNIDL